MATPGYEIPASADSDLLSSEQSTLYRALVARANYLAADRPDIQFAVKELARSMASPSHENWNGLKRLGRYLRGAPRLVYDFEWQEPPTCLRVFTDSDWAGCKGTRKSTSGGVVMHGAHCVKSYAKTQVNLAPSSGEVELYAAVKASSEGLGFKSLARDFDHKVELEVIADASAALGIISRKGLGKLRHIETQFLWVQRAAAEKAITYSKTAGSLNPADILTKSVEAWRLQQHLPRIGVQVRADRAVTAPTLS